MPWISDSQSYWFPKDLKAGIPSLIIQFTSLPPNGQECSLIKVQVSMQGIQVRF